MRDSTAVAAANGARRTAAAAFAARAFAVAAIVAPGHARAEEAAASAAASAALATGAQAASVAAAAPSAATPSAATPSAAPSAATSAPRAAAWIRVPRVVGRLTARDIGLVINTADPYSVEVGAAYIRARHLAPAQVLRVQLPLRPLLMPDELKRLRESIDSRFGPAT